MTNENKNPPFELDKKAREQANSTMVKMLFKILYKNNQITQKEYETLINNANRTFKLENN